MNLYSFVKNPFTENAEIDYDLLYRVAYEQQRLADDLVDLEIEKIDKIINKIKNDPEDDFLKLTELNLWKRVKKAAENGRRTGCGITALGDMIAALNLQYGSEGSKSVVDEVMKIKMQAELDCTTDLAVLRGSFEGHDFEEEFVEGDAELIDGNNRFYSFILNKFPDQAARIANHGRRNVSWSTIAPTGSVSLLANTSSGCEPVFKAYHTRRRRINPSDENSRVDFIDKKGEKWQEYPVLHPKFKEWIVNSTLNLFERNGENYIVFEKDKNFLRSCYVDELSKEELQFFFEQSPCYDAEAEDIPWKDRLEMQSILQKYTSNAISSTLNLREDIPVSEVDEIYSAGYNLGLKGVTIFVSGSKPGILVSDTSEFQQTDAPKRPDKLEAHAYVTSVKGKKFNVIVGLYDDCPYEVFAFASKNLKGEGVVVKQGSGEYDFIQLTDSNSIHRVITDDMSDEQAALTRLISTSLRHGTKIDFIVDQLNKTEGDITSFSKAISRILKKYATQIKGKCEDCGSNNVTMQEGCMSCLDCGLSKCE